MHETFSYFFEWQQNKPMEAGAEMVWAVQGFGGLRSGKQIRDLTDSLDKTSDLIHTRRLKFFGRHSSFGEYQVPVQPLVDPLGVDRTKSRGL
jgi:hypothetical protein